MSRSVYPRCCNQKNECGILFFSCLFKSGLGVYAQLFRKLVSDGEANTVRCIPPSSTLIKVECLVPRSTRSGLLLCSCLS